MSDTNLELDPQMREALATAAKIVASLGPFEPGIDGIRRRADLGRRYWNEGGPSMSEVLEVQLPGTGRMVSALLYKPFASDQPRPAFVYLHGGGFSTGSPRSNDRQMREIAAAWGGIVVSIDYRHSPEHVFPAAIEETAAVLRWLHDHGGSFGIDTSRLAYGGSSAGAAVAFGAAVELGGPPWLRAAVSIVGAFSADTSTDSMQRYGASGLLPDRASVPPMFAAYFGQNDAGGDPRADLMRADAALFAPVFMVSAELDVFSSSSYAFARHLAGAGTLREHRVYPGVSHLFFGFSRVVDKARQCTQDIATFLAHELPVAAMSSPKP